MLSKTEDNSGQIWVEIEFKYIDIYRRAWVVAKHQLSISDETLYKLPTEGRDDYIGYGTVTATVAPSYGPGREYATYINRDYVRNDRVCIIRNENGYCMVESMYIEPKTAKEYVFRCWIPASAVRWD